MHVTQFFNPLLRSRDVEIIEALLPDRPGESAGAPRIRGFRMSGLTVKQLCKSLLDDFQYNGRIAHIRLGDQEVKVLGHDDVADHHKSIFLPCTLQNAQEEIAARAGSQLRPPLVAATGYEMKIVPTVPAFQTFRHTLSLVIGQMCSR